MCRIDLCAIASEVTQYTPNYQLEHPSKESMGAKKQSLNDLRAHLSNHHTLAYVLLVVRMNHVHSFPRVTDRDCRADSAAWCRAYTAPHNDRPATNQWSYR